jgi:hypothetical protein
MHALLSAFCACSNCIYLQDSGVEVEGLKFYGTPWTNSVGMGFSKRSKQLNEARMHTRASLQHSEIISAGVGKYS